jgi:hypothetical protein
LPECLRPFVETEYPYRLDGVLPVTVIRLRIPAADILPAVWAVALALRPERYFANFIGDDDMFVALPSTLICIPRSDPTAAVHTRQIGTTFGIPAHQMYFEAMFEADHPGRQGVSLAP